MVDIQINTNRLTHLQFLIPELNSNLIEGVNTATVHLESGEYTFQMPPLAGLMANEVNPLRSDSKNELLR